MELGDAVIVDADNNEVHTQHNDLEALPEEVVSLMFLAICYHCSLPFNFCFFTQETLPEETTVMKVLCCQQKFC